MSISIQRLTLFAIFDALERDFRSVISSRILPYKEIQTALTDDEYQKVKKRANSTIDAHTLNDSNEEDLIQFLDFLDTIKIINRNKDLLSGTLPEYFSNLTPKMEMCSGIRNRVMHGRPLTFEDFPSACALASELSGVKEGIFPRLTDCLRQIEQNEAYLFGLDFSILDQSKSGAFHNLPFPDFDDTGFIGRKKLNRELKSALLGSFPIISVVGAGGVGKSAITLKTAYDILDSETSPFEAIVWVSAKANKLTAKEIERIEDAIEDSLGLFSSVLEQFDEPASTNPEDQIIELMTTFKILLIIDNLETVLDERLRRFVKRTPPGSKVLITSRIGIETGLPIEVRNLTKPEARSYFRKLTQAYNANSLAPLQDQEIDRYIGRLTANPLFLKWFVTAVKAGTRPEKLLADQKDVLAFCFQNVFRHLSQNARMICNAFVAVPGSHSQPLISELTALSAFEIEKSLSELLAANIISMRTPEGGAETQYDVMDLARAYLRRIAMLSTDEAKTYTGRYNRIRMEIQEASVASNEQFYRLAKFCVKNLDQAIIAKDLGSALVHIRNENFDEARDLLERASSLAPNYFEVPRVQAFLNYKSGNYVASQEAYDLAIELEPNWGPIHFWYGGFLLRAFGNLETALKHFEVAQNLQPSSLVEREIARVHLYLENFEKARKIIDELLDRGSMPDRRKIMLLDLEVQCFTRHFEREIKAGNFDAALCILKDANDFISNIPEKLRDEKLVCRITRVDSSFNILLTGCADSSTKDECYRIVQSLRQISCENFN